MAASALARGIASAAKTSKAASTHCSMPKEVPLKNSAPSAANVDNTSGIAASVSAYCCSTPNGVPLKDSAMERLAG